MLTVDATRQLRQLIEALQATRPPASTTQRVGKASRLATKQLASNLGGEPLAAVQHSADPSTSTTAAQS